jgi:hypothetical protein
MTKVTQSAKWFLSFAFVALFATATFTGCEGTNSALAPTSQNPTYANPHAANGADLGHAMDVQNRHHDDMMAIDGVTGTASGLNDDGTPAIYVFTNNDKVHGVPSSLEDVKTHIQNIGDVNAFVTGFPGPSPTPVQSGYSVGNDNECAAGTISCVVTLNGTDRYLLSNNHVFARVNAAHLGERIDQPGRYDAATITGLKQCDQTPQVATLSTFVPINFNRRSTNVVDCALAKLDGVSATSLSAGGYLPSVNTVAPAVGMAVKKSGRTTGLTHGSILAINWQGKINYGNGQTATFVNQVYISSSTFSAAGDSGSLIVTDDANANPVCLLFAGSSNSTIANPISAVLGALHATIVP